MSPGARVNTLGPAVNRHVAMAREAGAEGIRKGKTEGRRRAPGRATRRLRSRPSMSPGPESFMLNALHVYTGTVALAENGDKTQLLALLLAARFRKPWPIVAGILVATLLNHALAAWAGQLVSAHLDPQVLRWLVAGSFIGIALWTLKPDTLEDERLPAHGAFIATAVAFFVAEIGDKTQVATILLAARFESLAMVVAGTTLGMLLANVPVVLLGSRFAQRLPLRTARTIAACIFLLLGAWVAIAGIAG
jgi:putative Ca2+/H+ antiporter (TMEM165/GDT1 family)